jgi:heterodisulfide reductase subunit B
MKTYCCGASAAVYDQEATLDLMAKIFKDALARGANCLVALCPVCQMNMDAYQEKFCSLHGIEQRLPVYFVTELLGYALGLDKKQLQIERHFVEAVRLIREIESEQQGETQT